MAESQALITAVRDALGATEFHAQRLLDHSSTLLARVWQSEYRDAEHFVADFPREWNGFCRALHGFCQNYHTPERGRVAIPERLSPRELLASFEAADRATGAGRSPCGMVHDYAWELRGCVRRIVPPAVSQAADDQPAALIRGTGTPTGPHHGFGFDIPVERLPAVRTALREFQNWNYETVSCLKGELTKEIRRARDRIPALVNGVPAPTTSPTGEPQNVTTAEMKPEPAQTALPPPSPASKSPSVTQLTYCLTSSGPLPPDLLAALNLAVEYAVMIDTILSFTRRPLTTAGVEEQSRRIVVSAINALRREYPYHVVLQPVSNELIAVSDPNARFGEANAHHAMLSLERRLMSVVWRAADLERWARCLTDESERMDEKVVEERFAAVCAAVAAEEWPDPKAIAVACQVEAAKAVQARVARPSNTPPTPEDVSVRPAANGGPTLPRPDPTADWKADLNKRLAAIYCNRPRGLDPPLADVFEAVTTAVRECTRLLASVPHLWNNPEDYSAITQGVNRAVEAARHAYLEVDVRLRRAGGPNAVLGALNDVLTIRDWAPATETTAEERNVALTKLHTERAEFFKRVDGRGVFDRMLEQLAHVPLETAGALLVSFVDERANEELGAPAPGAVPTPPVPIPSTVRDWLASRYLLDPTPDRLADSETPIVFERLELFCNFLLSQQLKLIPTLEACRSAGLTEDVMFDVSEVPLDVPGVLARQIRRLDLSVGRNRVLGIYKTVTESQPTEPLQPEPSADSRATGKKGKNVNALMLAQLASDPTSLSWSASEWAEFLDCSAGTVKETKAWTELVKNARALQAAEGAERMDKSRTNPKGRRQKPT